MNVDRKVTSFALLTLSITWMTLSLVIPSVAVQTAKKVSFSREVLPILSDKCFKCHGPDSAGRQAGLRLDRPDGAFSNRGGRFAIVPGKPDHSMVVSRITNSKDPMPPMGSGKSLSKAEIATLTKWISEGAQYDRLWSFEPVPAVVPVPKITSNWPHNDIDRFVLARLNQEHLKPTPPASRERWLRRVTLDLTGLNPTVPEIEAFQADKRPDASEKVVDHLLASRHFGERAAVEWLDAARYSDSYGYQSDLLSPTWPYRDWVVKAFNSNKRYDEFLTEQIAGDLLPVATRDQKLATAFSRLHRQSNEGGSIPLEFKTTYANDRVDTFGSAVLGLTVGCARCHDHKFDPITQKEYYQLFAYFNSIDEFGLLLSTEIVPTPSLLLPTPDQEKKLLELKESEAKIKSQIAESQSAAQTRFDDWRTKLPSVLSLPDRKADITLDTENGGKYVDKTGGTAFAQTLDKVEIVSGRQHKAALFTGDNGLAVRGLNGRERWDAFTWSFWLQDTLRSPNPVVLLHRTGGTDVGFCGLDILLEDGYLTARVMRAWPGDAVAVRTTRRMARDSWTHLAWTWDGSGNVNGLKLYLDGQVQQTETVADRLWKKINAYGDLGAGGGDWTFGERFRDAGFKGGKVSELSFYDRAISDLEAKQLATGNAFKEALEDPVGHKTELRGYYLSALDPQERALQAKMRDSQKAIAEFEEGIYEIPVMEESRKPIPAYVLARGNYDAPRNAQTLVSRNVPKSLPALGSLGRNDRLTLARWTVRKDNPLTARVAVNRLWQMMFGVGLVETSENLGVQGSRPSHPQLLDYLARSFVDSGWNTKALLRQIALSSTYRQDSMRTQKTKNFDPDNRLLSRGPSRRLSAEMIRDTALEASGLLNDKLGGAPVNPYQPAGIWQENNTMSPGFVQSKGSDLYRRSIYSTWKRTTPVPSMLLFDATSREACSIRRPPTNTPLQALVLLNDIQFVEAARVLAELVLRLPGDDANRIQMAFLRLAGRKPNALELDVLKRTLAEQTKQFEAAPKDAAKLISMGDSKPDSKLDPIRLASMTIVAQEILNSDAVIWKR